MGAHWLILGVSDLHWNEDVLVLRVSEDLFGHGGGGLGFCAGSGGSFALSS